MPHVPRPTPARRPPIVCGSAALQKKRDRTNNKTIREKHKKKIEALGQEKLQLQGRLAMVAGGGGGGDALGVI